MSRPGSESTDARSLATGLRSLGDPSITYPLSPPLTAGCPETSTDAVQYPLEVAYDYDAVDPGLFAVGGPAGDGGRLPSGLDRWAPLLPPLAPIGLGEGDTPLLSAVDVADAIGLDTDLVCKDESQNPTWSQKDRLARCVVSAAVREGARGVVASSTGNHGAAVAAFAARAGIEAVVVTSPETPAAVKRFVDAYGATVLAVPDAALRRETVDRLADEGFHPVSTRTPVHTGHPYGPEGYKTIAYELHRDLGRVPATVAVPTCYAELLYGVWKGFRELDRLGVADGTPRMLACEPAARGPLREALATDEPVASVPDDPTEAYSIAATTSSVRGRRAVSESGGAAIGFSEADLASAEERLAHRGTWQESAGAGAVAGLARAVADGRASELGLDEGPVVAICTSSGFKNGEGRAKRVPRTGERGAKRAADGEGRAKRVPRTGERGAKRPASGEGRAQREPRTGERGAKRPASGEADASASGDGSVVPVVDPDWESVAAALAAAGHLDRE
ncbi:threonine synthase [Halovivax cerinus]|uniref:Pyridoxal-phosphate dependent enzyme n=1 Tax=Halovivax cerinus TaxID=1487865 RepID=A0ABD5NRT6_9EURY|nr:pyridoxal-phosphate dependent enzyme [Halovivax cerinus]